MGIDASSVSRLLAGGAISTAGLSASDLRRTGLVVHGSMASLSSELERLDEQTITKALNRRAFALWPSFEVVPYIESTNSTLVAQAERASGKAIAAEYQHGGRGRRGRVWQSPVGRNISLSAAWQTSMDMSAMEGLSLVVGLAVADALQSAGVADIALKWPNDVLLNGAKVGGILIELQPSPVGVAAVVGIGINYAGAPCMREYIEQPLADVYEVAPQVRRNLLLAGILNALADYLEQFAEFGFVGMVEAWNAMHAYHQLEVQILGNASSTVGVAIGVTATGRLKLRTAAGIEIFSAGDVSLRSLGMR